MYSIRVDTKKSKSKKVKLLKRENLSILIQLEIQVANQNIYNQQQNL